MKQLILILFIVTASPLFAAITDEERLTDPALEQKAIQIFKQIRCMVCSGESIYDSRAELARDIRSTVRQQVKNGATESEITSFLTTRYGNEILMETPLSTQTLLLWLAPVFLLAAGIYFITFRRKH